VDAGSCTRWLMAAALLTGCGASQGQEVRPAVCAGTWYPADKTDLSSLVDRLIAEAPAASVPGRPIALIVPHAGLRYSGPVAASGYKLLQGHKYERVIILAISHRLSSFYRGASVLANFSAFQTPLGQVNVDQQACQALLQNNLFRNVQEADAQEHSLEIQLPFLQRVLGPFHLVPILVGQCESQDYEPMAQALRQIVNDQTLLVASSDFTHYGPAYGYVPFTDNVQNRLTELADRAIKPILACDSEGFGQHVAQTGDTICGRNAVRLMLRVLQLLGGADGTLLQRDTSGRITGDLRNSVTYVSVAFTAAKSKRPAPPPPPSTQPEARFSPQERRTLLQMARETVATYLRDHKRLQPQAGPWELTAKIQEPGAAFVTLRRDGQLRGCIGETMAMRPLIDSVVDNAINAATSDPRFADNRVTLDELSKIDFEISVLSAPEKVESIDQIVLGRDGVILQRGNRKALFLPQVADETGWSKEMFLSRLAMKAGLQPAAWQEPGTTFYTFTAEVFGERDEQPSATSRPSQ
jgi:AmmeMemoRadiSam system protein B/AmmeMemoRadiSam system protein A